MKIRHRPTIQIQATAVVAMVVVVARERIRWSIAMNSKIKNLQCAPIQYRFQQAQPMPKINYLAQASTESLRF
ncbi:hypothetical protein AN652_17010 [Xanthomonas arboricola pv. pruni]|uniref:Secreted protein n=1 Tax=Xanthomonas cissicola TaxID=86186 RepID=A0ABX3M0U0_9XANT|nr:hypothetical protein DK27_20775 [Xanthomonas arboricola pv. pruni]OOW67257.1 hypothetical protein Xant_21385 [Xanthomonas cissicola]OQP71748.1 hypothetical protein IB69_017380 [Xanthomonas citri]PPT95032.1 hypothetical protein XaraCFBP7407_12765 [Xanthomonas arboricola pv. arracaciae]KPN08564.1 hypothetical protein AN652_17010 [Xanthomonas arboricola pv. pruni]